MSCVLRTTQYQHTKSPTKISSNCRREGGKERRRKGGRKKEGREGARRERRGRGGQKGEGKVWLGGGVVVGLVGGTCMYRHCGKRSSDNLDLTYGLTWHGHKE